MALPVIFSPEAIDQLEDLEAYIAERSYIERAIRYVRRLTKFCQGLGLAPNRGQRLDDFRPGTRKVGFERRITVVFQVTSTEVTILGIYYGGKEPPFSRQLIGS